MVCGNCTKLGRVIGGGVVRTPNPVQTSFRSAGGPTAPPPPSSHPTGREPEYEIDPQYNVKIRQAREKMGLSQDQLGMMLNEKPSVVRMVETGKLKPDPMLARKFMHLLKIDLFVSLSELEGHKPSI